MGVRRIRLVTGLWLSLAAWLLISGLTGAQGKTPVAEPTVSLNRRNASVRDVLSDVFRQAHVRYRLVDVAPARMSLQVTRVPWRTALRMVLKTVTSRGRPLTYAVKGGVYVVYLMAAPAQRRNKPSSRARR